MMCFDTRRPIYVLYIYSIYILSGYIIVSPIQPQKHQQPKCVSWAPTLKSNVCHSIKQFAAAHKQNSLARPSASRSSSPHRVIIVIIIIIAHTHTHRAHSNILRRDRRRRRRLIVCFKNQFLGERAANVFISLKETIIPILAMLQRRASLYAERVCIVQYYSSPSPRRALPSHPCVSVRDE